MKVDVQDFGTEQNRLVVIDDFLPDAACYVDLAASLAPFPAEGTTAYPGQRLHVAPDQPASRYVLAALKAAAPVMQSAFNIDGVQILEATFSVLTQRPSDLTLVQRLPHRDSTDPNHFAVLHHL